MKNVLPLFLLISCIFLLGCNKKTPPASVVVNNPKSSYLLTARTLFQDEDVSMDLQKKGQILALVNENQNLATLENKWNKKYYNNLLHHYLPSPEEENKLNLILKKYDNLDLPEKAKWPEVISDQMYQEMYQLIGKDFVKTTAVNDSLRNKYTILVNPDFWTFTTQSDYPLLVDIISSYERDFENYELFHDNEEKAWNYAIIIFERLCNNRNPDNSYYYNLLTAAQIDRLDPKLQAELNDYDFKYNDALPLFNFSTYRSTKAKEYSRIFSEHKKGLAIHKHIFSNLEAPPFFIEKIN